MIRILAALVGLFALFPAATVLAHEGTEVIVNGEVRPDGPVQIEGEGFEPNDVVRIELRKDGVEPIELGRVPADDEGAFIETLHVPATVAPGLYQLAADGQESATFDLTVLEPEEGSEPAAEPARPAEPVSNDRPAGETVGLAIFTAAIAVAAGGLLWFSRTRARSLGAGSEGGSR